MSIRQASIALGATYAPTGGTATNVVPINSDANTVRAFIGTTGVTPLNRTELQFSAKSPRASISAPGGFTQGRSSAKVLTPKVLANLKRTINTGEVSMSFDPETTAAEQLAMKLALCALILDADFDQFWANQSID